MGFSAAAVGAAAISAGSQIYSGSQSANASKNAAGAQVAAENQALAYQKQIYGQTQGNLQPYITGGQNALSGYLGALGLPGGSPGGPNAAFNAFQNTQAYQFPLQQGNLALNRQLAAMGLGGSGAALKDSIGYNQGYASQNYQNYLSQLAGLAGAGQNAAGSLGSIGLQTGSQVGSTLGAIGNAQAAGIIGANNATQGGVGGATNTLTNPNASPSGSSPIGQAVNGIGNWLSGLGQSSYGTNVADTQQIYNSIGNTFSDFTG